MSKFIFGLVVLSDAGEVRQFVPLDQVQRMAANGQFDADTVRSLNRLSEVERTQNLSKLVVPALPTPQFADATPPAMKRPTANVQRPPVQVLNTQPKRKGPILPLPGYGKPVTNQPPAVNGKKMAPVLSRPKF